MTEPKPSAPKSPSDSTRQDDRMGEVTEHAICMSGGSMQVRPNYPGIERIYPLEQWIPDHQRFGGKVCRRRIIVVEDWTEVPRG